MAVKGTFWSLLPSLFKSSTEIQRSEHNGICLKLVFISNNIIDETISIKYFLLTNHDP